MNFLGLDHSFEESRFIVIPAEIGGTSVGSKGAENAPESIIKASWQIEDWDTELKFDFTEEKFHTTKPLHKLDELYEASLKVFREGKIPVIIGGEHFISHVVLKAMKEVYGEDISAIFFDAHADMFDEFNGNKMSHACALFLSLPFINDFISIGVRNIAKREIQIIREKALEDKFIFFEDVVRIEKSGETKINVKLIDKKIRKLKGKVIYISFDFDFVDPGYLPSLSTPEPPGFSYMQTFFVLKTIINYFGDKIKGFDFVEFCPQGIFSSEVSAAKIISKSLAYLSFKQLSNKVTGKKNKVNKKFRKKILQFHKT